MSLFWILVGILVLGVMVLVHEWGHFVVAKLFGVRVEIFSIGFGRRLFGWRRGPTDYRVSALPLGGYVKMVGDNPAEERAGAPDEFLSKPRWQRVLIALAGPAMNLLMAVLLLAGLFSYHFERPAFRDEPAVIGLVHEDSPAARAGFEAGDSIVKFGAVSDPTWEDVLIETIFAASGPVVVEVDRAGERLQLELLVPPGAQEAPLAVGWVPDIRFVVRMVVPESPSARAGLQPGDMLLALEGEPLRLDSLEANPLSERLQRSGGQPVTLTIERNGTEQKITVTPVYGDHPEGKRWLLGIGLGQRMVEKDLTVWEALEVSVAENFKNASRMLDLVGRLFTGRTSLRAVQGPVGIVRFSGEIGQQGGLLAVVNLMSVISLSLGILNLLPIPILDGGHIVIFAIEGFLRRDLSLRLKERIVQLGFVFLVLVILVVTYNDLVRIFTD